MPADCCSMRQTDVCLKVIGLSGEDVSIWVPGDSSIRDVKLAVRDELNKESHPLWQLLLMTGATSCADDTDLDQYDLADGLQLSVNSPEAVRYDEFYGRDVHLQAGTAILGQRFLLLTETRKQDLVETLAMDARIHATVGKQM
jgi:hypothetical protein